MIVKVDRSTVRRNPDRKDGNVVYIPGRVTYSEVKVYQADGGWVKESWTSNVMVAQEIAHVSERPKGWKPSTSMTQEHQPLYHFADRRKFLYEHEDPIVTCEGCRESFRVSEFKQWANDEGDFWCNTICPKCEAWHGADVTYERLTDEECENILAD